jgi:serine/threonine protein kinase
METNELIKDDLLRDVLSELQDSYDYIKTIGKGAQSKVYQLYHRHLKQNRALKIMNISRSLMEENISDIKEEFSKKKDALLKKLNHTWKLIIPILQGYTISGFSKIKPWT